MTIRIDRLKLLAYYLASIPAHEFNIAGWRKCSIGWATQIPEFAELGFHMSVLERGHGGSPVPTYGNHKNWHAVEEFFGLSYNDAQYLFSMFAYDEDDVTPKQVVSRIKQFVKGK